MYEVWYDVYLAWEADAKLSYCNGTGYSSTELIDLTYINAY